MKADQQTPTARTQEKGHDQTNKTSSTRQMHKTDTRRHTGKDRKHTKTEIKATAQARSHRQKRETKKTPRTTVKYQGGTHTGEPKSNQQDKAPHKSKK